MTKLKPCPFCGGEAEMKHVNSRGRKISSKVCCRECGIEGKTYLVDVSYSSDEKATEAWNRRVSDD